MVPLTYAPPTLRRQVHLAPARAGEQLRRRVPRPDGLPDTGATLGPGLGLGLGFALGLGLDEKDSPSPPPSPPPSPGGCIDIETFPPGHYYSSKDGKLTLPLTLTPTPSPTLSLTLTLTPNPNPKPNPNQAS